MKTTIIEKKDYYCVNKKIEPELGMKFLRKVFINEKNEPFVDMNNIILFSTCGIHGSYNKIEDIEDKIKSGNIGDHLTFIYIQPRTVNITYGNCIPETIEDIKFLRYLRQMTHYFITQCY